MELRCIYLLDRLRIYYKNEDFLNKIILNCILEFCFIYFLIIVFEVCNVSCRIYFNNWFNGKVCINLVLIIYY